MYIPETTIYFNKLTTAYLFFNELSGQISDGKYENSRPYGHWRWVTNVNGIYSSTKFGYSGCFRTKKYNLREWPGYINKSIAGDTDYDWAWRVYYGARFINVYENNSDAIKNVVIKTLQKSTYTLENAICLLGYMIKENPNVTYFEFIEEYRKNENRPLDDLITEEAFNMYKDSNYSLKDLKADLKLLADTVNIYIY